MQVSAQLYALAALMPKNEPQVPIAYQAKWTPYSGRFGKYKFTRLYRESNQDPSVIQPRA
jgi:hypothetical protein